MSRKISKTMHYFAILNNLDKQKESTVDQTSMHEKGGTRSKQLPEVRRGRKSQQQEQSSRQVYTRNARQTGASEEKPATRILQSEPDRYSCKFSGNFSYPTRRTAAHPKPAKLASNYGAINLLHFSSRDRGKVRWYTKPDTHSTHTHTRIHSYYLQIRGDMDARLLLAQQRMLPMDRYFIYSNPKMLFYGYSLGLTPRGYLYLTERGENVSGEPQPKYRFFSYCLLTPILLIPPEGRCPSTSETCP